MIPRGVEIFVAIEPIDLRWSFDWLSGVAASVIGRDARCGALFVFVGKRKDACKVLFFDGSGLCQFYKLWTMECSPCPIPTPARPRSFLPSGSSTLCSTASTSLRALSDPRRIHYTST